MSYDGDLVVSMDRPAVRGTGIVVELSLGGQRMKPVQPPPAARDGTSVEEAWLEARTNLDDDDAQQRFIQACLKAKDVRLAVDRYRALHAQAPDDQRVARYLDQVGTILGFCALARAPHPAETPAIMGQVRTALGLFLAAALGLSVVILMMT